MAYGKRTLLMGRAPGPRSPPGAVVPARFRRWGPPRGREVNKLAFPSCPAPGRRVVERERGEGRDPVGGGGRNRAGVRRRRRTKMAASGSGAAAGAGPSSSSSSAGGGGGAGGSCSAAAAAAAAASNPRKFSEKIALQKQRQAEETAAFEEVMMELGTTRDLWP
ncbi:UNVERIFIED_CONTAM: hypothetical protein K2H54_020523 [Gekko kuhli]